MHEAAKPIYSVFIFAHVMARLFRLEESGELVKAGERPFTNEVSEMEPFIKRNPSILRDVFIFGEQITSSGRDKRTDLLAVDKNREVLIIELKKDQVDKSILNQVLAYENYWKKHPDAAKSIWMSFPNKPPRIEPDWEGYDPHVTIVAPFFDSELVEISNSKKLGIRFVEISRYQYERSIFIVVNEPEALELKETVVSARGGYNWDWYAENSADEDQVKVGKYLLDEIVRFSKQSGWEIEPKFNK